MHSLQSWQHAGEIYGGLEIPAGRCDGEVLLQALGESDADVVAVLSRIEGPWAVVYWQQETQTLWVARDALGEQLREDSDLEARDFRKPWKDSSRKLQWADVPAFE